MDENKKPRIDFLKWWLVIVTILSIGVLFILVFQLIGLDWDWILGPTFMVFLIVVIPILSIMSWKYYLSGNKRLSTILSIIQILFLIISILLTVGTIMIFNF